MKKEVVRIFPGQRENAETHVVLKEGDKISGDRYLVSVGYTMKGGIPTSWGSISLTAEEIAELAPMLLEMITNGDNV